MRDDSVNESKLLTAVFVDYESWFWGLYNNYGQQTPNLEALIFNLKYKHRAALDQIYFFGDFSHNEMQQELHKIRDYSNLIIDCATPNSLVQKNYTDFLMLDEIYRTTLRRNDIDQYVLVTGDGHFNSVVVFLKNYRDKIVGLFGVKGTISPKLKSSASWYVEIEPQYEYQKLLETIYDAERKSIIPSFSKVVMACTRYNREVRESVASSSLKKLIDDGYINQREIELPNGQKVRALETDWNLLTNDGIWNPENLGNSVIR